MRDDGEQSIYFYQMLRAVYAGDVSVYYKKQAAVFVFVFILYVWYMLFTERIIRSCMDMVSLL